MIRGRVVPFAGRRWRTAAMGAVLALTWAAVSVGAAAAIGQPVAVPVAGVPVALATAAGGDDTQVSSSSVGNRAPLVLVVDLSGSMLDKDDTGTIRLDGAKTGLLEVVRNQPRGSQVGLWTFPTPGDDCGAGTWVQGAALTGASGDLSGLEAQIRALTANGGTPTGPALQAVADDLRQRGITEATIMLVSDGESNCGTPPCEVAEALVTEGFDLTVMAMGFQVSDDGRKQLQCIAETTGGKYFDAADSQALRDVLDQVSVPQLEITASAPTSVPAGMGVTITVSVTNPSAKPVTDVSTALVFTNEGKDSIFLAAQPPRYRLGNIPAGGTVTRTWSLSTPVGTEGKAAWRVSAWAPGLGSLQTEGTIAVSDQDPTLDQAGPIVKDALAAGPLVILGDSYSSGEGTVDYIDLGSVKRTLCHRSFLTYGVTLAGKDLTEIIACSGAVTADLMAPNSDHDQNAQLFDLFMGDNPPGLVALTLGGNDIGFKAILTKCFMPGDCGADKKYADGVYSHIANLGADLERSYRDINKVINAPAVVKARGTIAPILVLPYPQVFPEWQRGSCSGFSASDIRFGNSVVGALDATIQHAVLEVAADGIPVYFVADARDAMLPQHTSCSDEPYVRTVDGVSTALRAYADWTGLTVGKLQELMHPNAAGHRATTNALVAWSQRETTPVAPTPVVDKADIIKSSGPTVHIEMGSGDSPTVTVRGRDGVEITVRDLEPGTSVVISVHSTPRVIGSLVANEDGVASGTIYIPADIEVGEHTLVAEGYGVDFAPVSFDAPLRVGHQRPWWFWPLSGLALAALAGAVVFAVLARRSWWAW